MEHERAVLVVEVLPNPGWHPTRLVYYAGGKIDFTIADVDSCTHSRHDRPVRVLVDKDGLTANLDQLQPAGTPPPVDDVLLALGHASKSLAG